MSDGEILSLQELQYAIKNSGSFDLGDFNYDTIETVLNLLEKKDTLIHTMQSEFERLEDLEDNTDMLKMELEKKDIDIIEAKEANRQLSVELQKKDKIIDLVAETLRYYNGMKQEQCFCIDICGEKECDMKNCKDRIKQYYERKVENGN